MADRVYFVPIIGTGQGKTDPRRPKYFGAVRVPWTMADYGLEPWGVVVADLSAPAHTSLAGQSDVFAVPAVLNSTLADADVTAFAAYLDQTNTPSNWITAGMTWRQVVRRILMLWDLFQRLGSISKRRLFGSGINLNTTMKELSPSVRRQFAQVARDLGLSVIGLTGDTTVREFLRALAEQQSGARFLGNLQV